MKLKYKLFYVDIRSNINFHIYRGHPVVLVETKTKHSFWQIVWMKIFRKIIKASKNKQNTALKDNNLGFPGDFIKIALKLLITYYN